MAKRTLIKKNAQPVDHIDGYSPPDPASMLHREVLDAYENTVTGVGDWTKDKTYGGQQTGPQFRVRFLSGAQCEDRYRGSDLGGRVVETIPNEMTRKWIDITIQPDDEDAVPDISPEKRALAEARAGVVRIRGDQEPAPAAEPPRPGALPDVDDESARVIEALEREQRALGAMHAFREALNFERAYGGGAVFLGVDDGEKDLTRPLDLDKVRRIKHLTAYRGGWDGELVAWRYYNDPREPKFGEPEIYQLRNLGVPIAMPPAPGETAYVAQMPPAGPTGALVFYVHESRLLLFPGTAVSRRARVQMRGWGDSIFTRVDEVLSQYGQTWGGIAILMQEWSQGILSIEGLATTLASKDPKAQSNIVARAQLLQITQSIARMRIIDAKEKYQREVTPMSGVAEVLNQFAMRLAAAANMPVSLLFGQVKGGLGDAGNTDLRYFYDQIESMQADRLVPPAQKLVQVQLRAKQGPTGGAEPKRWSVKPRALFQLNEQEQAELRNKQAQTDQVYFGIGAVSAEEIAASRFGGSKYSTDTVLDLEGRQKMGAAPAPAPGGPGLPPGAPTQNPGPGAPPTGQTPAPRPGGSPAQIAAATGGPPAPAARQPGPEPEQRGDAEWSEELHSRDPSGKFGEGGGGGATSASPETATELTEP